MFSDLGQNMCLRVVECPLSRRVHIRRVWCRWNRGPPQRFTWLLKFELRAHILCSRMFSDLGKNMCLRVVECPLSRRVDMRWGLCRWNRRTSPGVHLTLNLKIGTLLSPVRNALEMPRSSFMGAHRVGDLWNVFLDIHENHFTLF